MDIWKIMSECVELTDEEKLEQLFTMLTVEGNMEKNKPCTEFKQLLMSTLPVELVTLFMLCLIITAELYTWISDLYDSIATVGEIRVYWRANFQSGSRVLKKVF